MKTQKEVNEWFSKNRIGKKDRKRADGFLMAHGLSIPELYNGEWAELDEFVGWFNSVKPEFKKGDYVVCINNANKIDICIYGADIWLLDVLGLTLGSCFVYPSYPRFATPEERKLLDNALAEDGRCFNPETKELEDIWQPKEGEIVALKDDTDCVFAWRKEEFLTGFYCGVTSRGKVSIYGDIEELAMARSAPISPATPTQKKRFDDSLAKEGYVWNPSTLKAKKVLEVPENISIFGCSGILEYSGILSIGFNGGKQILWYSEFFGNYMVAPGQSSDKKVRCKLVPCKREDLKAGDIAFATDMDDSSQKNLLEYYLLVLSDTESCYIEGNGSIEVNGCTWKHWYKVTQIE